jgi:predicted nucleic acid-binding protein
VRFWDTSAIVPTFLAEAASPIMRRLTAEDPEMAVWWATPVECLAAISRRERSGGLPREEAVQALSGLSDLAAAWVEVPPTEALRDAARRIVRVHDVRTADALQIAAATAISDQRPERLELVTLDERLALAARREGFPVLP